MHSSDDRARRLGERLAGARPRKLEAFVVCMDSRCGYYQGFFDIRGSPEACPRCGGPLLRECATCQMLLRSSSPICRNCGRPIGLGSPKGR